MDDACCIVLLGAYERATITNVAEMIGALEQARSWAQLAHSVFEEFREERDRALEIVRYQLPVGDEIDD